MKPQQILNNPEQAIEERWGSAADCPYLPEIENLVADVKAIKSRIKSLKADKGKVSRVFRQQELADAELTQGKEQIKRISQDIKSTESELREKVLALEALFSDEGQAPSFPDRFSALQPERSSASAQSIVLANESVANAWDEYVSLHSQATVYHQFRWKRTFENAHGIKGYYIAARSDKNQIVGVLPCFQLTSKLFGNILVSLPYVNYGGPLADNEEVEQALLAFAKSQTEAISADHLEIRSLRKLNEWPKKSDKISMLLSLPKEKSMLLDQLGTKTRAQINQSKRNGVYCKFDKSELLDDFYSVFAHNMRDLGTPVYARAFFNTIISDFHDEATLAVAYHNNKPVAAGFLLASGDTLEIPWASSLRKKNHLNANMFMYSQILEFAVEQGFRCFDFGRSTIDSPTYRFKKQWGAQPVQHYWHYSLKKGNDLPAVNPNNPKYKLLINIWKKLPVWLTKLIGPHIVKYIP